MLGATAQTSKPSGGLQSPSERGNADRETKLKEYEETLDDMKSSFLERWRINSRDNAKLDDFDRHRTLGTGAFGRVILVRYKPTSTYYAMKILEKKKIVKTKQIDHIMNEKKVLQSVKFPFVVNMEFCFKDNSYVYMVLPFVSGGEMFSHLRRMGHFDQGLAKFYAAQVTLALEYLHHCGLVYRDLKPENILIDASGYLRLTDFGFCKMIETRAWTLCGTPEYLAPELILSKGYGKSVDWWSFGVLVYEMNAGYPPFFSHDPMRIYEKIVAGKFRFAKHFDDDLRDILKNVLQTDLTRRYGNLKNGTMDIKLHRWFSSIDWSQLYNRKLVPTFVPRIGKPDDTSNFDKYDEEELQPLSTDLYVKEFAFF